MPLQQPLITNAVRISSFGICTTYDVINLLIITKHIESQCTCFFAVKALCWSHRGELSPNASLLIQNLLMTETCKAS